ncbi:hypothetical protein EV176_007470, partial [Coemansia sp. RSA 451]
FGSDGSGGLVVLWTTGRCGVEPSSIQCTGPAQRVQHTVRHRAVVLLLKERTLERKHRDDFGALRAAHVDPVLRGTQADVENNCVSCWRAGHGTAAGRALFAVVPPASVLFGAGSIFSAGAQGRAVSEHRVPAFEFLCFCGAEHGESTASV